MINILIRKEGACKKYIANHSVTLLVTPFPKGNKALIFKYGMYFNYTAPNQKNSHGGPCWAWAGMVSDRTRSLFLIPGDQQSQHQEGEHCIRHDSQRGRKGFVPVSLEWMQAIPLIQNRTPVLTSVFLGPLSESWLTARVALKSHTTQPLLNPHLL